jgi:hypothetical protein
MWMYSLRYIGPLPHAGKAVNHMLILMGRESWKPYDGMLNMRVGLQNLA